MLPLSPGMHSPSPENAGRVGRTPNVRPLLYAGRSPIVL